MAVSCRPNDELRLEPDGGYAAILAVVSLVLMFRTFAGMNAAWLVRGSMGDVIVVYFFSLRIAFFFIAFLSTVGSTASFLDLQT